MLSSSERRPCKLKCLLAIVGFQRFAIGGDTSHDLAISAMQYVKQRACSRSRAHGHADFRPVSIAARTWGVGASADSASSPSSAVLGQSVGTGEHNNYRGTNCA